MWSACHKKSYSKLEIWNLKSAVSALCGCLSFAWGKVSWIFQNSSIRHITNSFSYDMPTTLDTKIWNANLNSFSPRGENHEIHRTRSAETLKYTTSRWNRVSINSTFFFCLHPFHLCCFQAGIPEKIFLVCENATLSSFIFSQLQ